MENTTNTKKKKKKEKRKNPSQPRCPQLNNTWFLFIHHTHNKHGTANPRQPFLLPWERHLFFVKHVWRQRKTIQFNWLNIFCTWNVDDISSWQAEAAWPINSSPTSFIYKTHTRIAHRHHHTNDFRMKKMWQSPIIARYLILRYFPCIYRKIILLNEILIPQNFKNLLKSTYLHNYIQACFQKLIKY